MTLRNIIALAFLWLLPLAPALAAIGTIDSFDGDVRVVSATADRKAQAGLQINEGDTVRTGAYAWVLLAMTDGASLTLRPNSQVRFDAYRYNADGEASQNSSTLALLKGALRSITGYIGRSNRSGYRIDTPTATIGIRGTDHEPAYYPPPGPGETMDHEPGTYDKVNDGESFIRNPKGEISVRRGQYAFVNYNRRLAPRLLQRPPVFYRRHAEFDKRAAARRQQFHHRFEQQHQRRLQERAQRPQQQRQNEKQKKGGNEKAEHPQQQQRRELIEQRKQERQAQQETRREQRAEELKKRRQDNEKKREHKKEHE